MYEERIVIVQAYSLQEAEQKLHDEAIEYESSLNGHDLLGYRLTYSTQETELQDGVEVWSLLREADLPTDDYLQAFHATDLLNSLLSEAQ